ncbi:hypothetical protein DOZ80_21970 [Pseudomonas fluorescens]|uniref:Uncharacterized protein n=1 Tax=Pseudomonas fluorescens TaxID=294 RepID=A0A327MVR3_PSEFL|nr:hypothetical protein DOZ80_21970 [Pseudomonas fluorescens]
MQPLCQSAAERLILCAVQAPGLEMIVTATTIQASFCKGEQTSRESELPRVQIETLELMEAKVHCAASVWCALRCMAL